jgi:hypothetical protein
MRASIIAAAQGRLVPRRKAIARIQATLPTVPADYEIHLTFGGVN